MSSVFDQQIRKLIEHIQSLNQALHERNMQIVQWQQVARAMQDERARVARALLDMLKQALTAFGGKFQGLRGENLKLRAYIDHQKQLHEVVARDMQGQLQYALTRIEELAAERANWRQEVHATQLAASQSHKQVAEQRHVAEAAQAAMQDMRHQLAHAQQFAKQEAAYDAELKHLHEEAAALKQQLATSDHAVALKEREVQSALADYEHFKVRASQEVQALQQEVAQAKAASHGVDDRVDEMTKLLANSEREVAKLFKELSEERALHNEAKIRLEAATKELRKAKTAVTKLEKAEKAAKGEHLSDLQKQLDEMSQAHKVLQEELASALRDKTTYMQALEGQKGKLRPLQPPQEGGSSG